jgi:hypothetical protein
MPQLLVVSLRTATIAATHSLDSAAGPAFMEYSSRSLVCATANGHVFLLDKRTFKLTHTLCQPSDSTYILAMDVMSNSLITCGMSFSEYQQAAVHDPFIKCYDLRLNKPLQPITATPSAALAK